MVYGALRHWPPAHFRATLQGYFLPTGLAIVVGHGLGGLWTAQVWRLYAFCLPLVLGAVALGGVVNRRMTGKQYDTLVYGFTIVMGVLLLV